MAILVYFVVILVYFSSFGMLWQEKPGSPGVQLCATRFPNIKRTDILPAHMDATDIFRPKPLVLPPLSITFTMLQISKKV
jgi:hypothetical protein